MSNYILVLTGALAYWAWVNRSVLALYARLPRAGTSAQADARWQEQWVGTLLRLQAELEASGRADAVELTRELVWRLIGGGQKPTT